MNAINRTYTTRCQVHAALNMPGLVISFQAQQRERNASMECVVYDAIKLAVIRRVKWYMTINTLLCIDLKCIIAIVILGVIV
jgi:hypothetical protein